MKQLDWDIQEFRAWIFTHTPIETCGTASDVLYCPIANWRRTYGEAVAVGEHIVIDGVSYCPPQWVEDFEELIDAPHEDRQEDITARECMDVVDVVMRTS